MGLFQKKRKPQTAAEYRQSAQEHLNAAKTMFFTFLKTGAIVVPAAIIIVVFAVAWFVSNSNVNGTPTSISVNGEETFYLATKASDHQGIYDNSSGNGLSSALQYFKRITDNETINGLPDFAVGISTVTASDNNEYIIGNADGISLMVNSTSNVNNIQQNDYVGPGSKGEITFYIIPRISGENTVHFSLSITPYGLSKIDNDVTSQQLNDTTLTNILSGHILLFEAKDTTSGEYSNQIYPEISSDGNVRFSFMSKANWENNTPVPITLYWIWPYRFENMIYPGLAESVFQTNTVEQSKLITWINQNKDRIIYKKQNETFVDADMNMSNADFSKWSNGYNRGDQLIGDKVAYFVWTISTDD